MILLKFGLAKKILVAFVVLTLLPLAAIGVMTLRRVSLLSDQAVGISETSLSDQAMRHILRLAEERAGQTDLFFSGFAGDARVLSTYAEDIYNNRTKFPLGAYPAFRYGAPKKLSTGLPAYGYINTSPGQGNGAWGDWDGRLTGTPYLNSSVVKRAETDANYSKMISEELNATMLMDFVMRPVYDKDQPSAALVWMVRLGGISNSYSRPNLNWGSLLAAGTITDNWNEDAEDYVTLANAANNPKRGVVWTRPYWDTVGNGWLISAISPIYRGSEFLGDAGVDVRLNDVTAQIAGLTVLKTGRAFLTLDDGTVMAHPNLEGLLRERMKVDDRYPSVKITELEDPGSDFVKAVDAMNGGGSGAMAVKYSNGKRYLVAYAPVLSTGMSLGIVVAEEEALEAARNAAATIGQTADITRMVVLVIDIAAIAVAVAVGAFVGRRIVRPIRSLIEIAGKIGTGELGMDAFQKGSGAQVGEDIVGRKDEIGALARSFQGMLKSIHEDVKKAAAQPKEVKVEIKDSVIFKSDIASAVQADAGPVLKSCPYCGKAFNLPKTPRYCPYCKEKVVK